MPAPNPTPVGTRFGQLTVTAERHVGETQVHVRCDCGAERTVAYSNLLTQQTCGAGHHKRGAANSNYRHGQATGGATSTYNIWAQIVQRTTNPRTRRWADYGGRGIDLDPRWRDFPTFLADMGERPDGLTIDRVDNDRGYWPDNCRWATTSEQAKNRRFTWGDRRTSDGRFA